MVYWYQMDSFILDEFHINLSCSSFANQYGSLTCEEYKNASLPLADWMIIVFRKLQHAKHWVSVSVSIYNLNCDKYILSKQGIHRMINFWKDEQYAFSYHPLLKTHSNKVHDNEILQFFSSWDSWRTRWMNKLFCSRVKTVRLGLLPSRVSVTGWDLTGDSGFPPALAFCLVNTISDAWSYFLVK